MPSKVRIDKKYEILESELASNQIRLMRLPRISKESKLKELYVCLHPSVHERLVPPYGVAFCQKSIPESVNLKLIPLDDEKTDDNRRFVDGRRSFMVFFSDKKPQLGIFESAFGDEYRLLQLSDITCGIVMQRLHTGTVKIFQEGHIYTCEGRRWSHKGPTAEAYSRLMACLQNSWTESLNETIRGLLRISFYSLSPESIGATLVCRLLDSDNDAGGIELESLAMSVLDDNCYPLISHILRFQDGATFVRPTGELQLTGVHLTYSSEAASSVPEVHGTRHTSAARYTFDHADVIAFVVSQDGPVTVFSDGANVAELPIESASKEVQWLKSISPRRKKEDIIGNSFTRKCHNCGRIICIEEVVVLGWKDHEQIDCPVCKKELYSSMCFSLKAYPVK